MHEKYWKYLQQMLVVIFGMCNLSNFCLFLVLSAFLMFLSEHMNKIVNEEKVLVSFYPSNGRICQEYFDNHVNVLF